MTPPYRPSAWAAGAAVALAALASAGRSSPDRVDPSRSVVLVLVDTLRADHLGVAGCAPRDATPSLDRLARTGAWFREAYSAAPWTPPSARSLLTGVDPAVHGLDRDAAEYVTRIPGLPPRILTLAELLRRRGYRTCAVTGGGGVGRRYGLDRGFESWYEPERQTGVDVAEGVDRALAWLDGVPRGEKTFLFLHTYEVHLPNTHHLFAAEERGDAAARAAAEYDGDLAFADGELGRFFSGLGLRGLLPRSLVVVTSDHGENLFDRFLGGHGVDHGHHLHRELTHVPLVFAAPGLLPACGPIDGTVSLLDVVPTVLALVGAAPPPYPVQGRDLRAVLQGLAGPDPDRAVFSGAPLQGPAWRSVRTARRALIVSPPVQGREWWHGIAVPDEATYDLARNPGENESGAALPPGETELLRKMLRDRRREEARLAGQLGEAVPGPGARSLRSLGYLR